MENQMINSLTTIQQNQSESFISTDDQKFRKVFFGEQEPDIALSNSIIYRAAIDGFQQYNQRAISIQVSNKCSNGNQNGVRLEQKETEEPQNLKLKFVPTIQKVHFQSSSKSKNKITIRQAKKSFGLRNKAFTVTRFSNKSNPAPQILYQMPQNEPSFIHQKREKLDLSQLNDQDSPIKKQKIEKRVRLKTNSMVGFSQFNDEANQNRCIPLQNFMNGNQLEESFWQNAYRLRKVSLPVWDHLSQMLSKVNDKNKKDQNKKYKTKYTPNLKEAKKIIYEGYDFNGKLILSTNMGKKSRKSFDEVAEINAEFTTVNDVQNLANYHEKKSKHAKSLKEIKTNVSDFYKKDSDFLDNLERLRWNKNIECLKHQQNRETDNKRKNSVNLGLIKQKQDKPKGRLSKNKKSAQQTKIIDHQELIEEFQKVRFSSFKSQVDQTNNFPFGFSKYVKIKKFQQKSTKSKSNHYHTLKYLSIPQKNLESQIQEKNNLKAEKKGPQKVRAHKKLFKQVFNCSLKQIEPQNREDIMTIKLIQNKENKQNAEDSEKEKQCKPLRKHLVRNSDTQLLKKGSNIKPTIFKQIKQNLAFEKIIKMNGTQKRAEQKSRFQDSKQENFESSKINQPPIFQQLNSPLSIDKENYRKDIAVPRNSLKMQNLQKVFKKQTKKTLIKQSANENRRQSFF